MRSTERINGQRIRCYDNGGQWADGGSIDRYTVVYLNYFEQYEGHAPAFLSLAMNEFPLRPNGIGMHVTAVCGSHLGRRIPFRDLPEQCRAAVQSDLTRDYSERSIPEQKEVV